DDLPVQMPGPAVFLEHPLAEPPGALVGVLLGDHEPADDLLWPRRPAKPYPGEEDLRAGARLQHHVRRERPQAGRWLSGGERRTGAGAERGGGNSRARGRGRQSAEAKLPVRDVLTDQEAIAAGQADKLGAAV